MEIEQSTCKSYYNIGIEEYKAIESQINYTKNRTVENEIAFNNNTSNGKRKFIDWIGTWINEAAIILSTITLAFCSFEFGYSVGQYHQLAKADPPNLLELSRLKDQIIFEGICLVIPVAYLVLSYLGYAKKIMDTI